MPSALPLEPLEPAIYVSELHINPTCLRGNILKVNLITNHSRKPIHSPRLTVPEANRFGVSQIPELHAQCTDGARGTCSRTSSRTRTCVRTSCLLWHSTGQAQDTFRPVAESNARTRPVRATQAGPAPSGNTFAPLVCLDRPAPRAPAPRASLVSVSAELCGPRTSVC